MTINIPNKAFHSFSTKQSVSSLYRIGKQIDEVWSQVDKRLAGLKILKGNLLSLQAHEDEKVATVAKHLLVNFPTTDRSMQDWLMYLERLEKMDLKDSDFLISTVDQQDKVQENLSPIHLVLDNLRSSFNVGGLLRSAEALGIAEVHLCGYTPTPENAKTAKSALGTDKWIAWQYWESSLECLDFLQQKGLTLYAFETAANAQDLNHLRPKFPCAIVLGNERYGLGSPVLKRADKIIKIPLYGKKNSLNVGVCGAISLNYFASYAEGI